MVFTTDNVSDTHIPVIYYHTEVVSWSTVSTTNDQIIQYAV